MGALTEVKLGAASLDRFTPILGEARVRAAFEQAEVLRRRLEGRVLWNVNSTAVGGGVAEMLRPLLGYARPLGIDARWLVIQGDADFFRVTKRLHHALHGSAGDGTSFDGAARRTYEQTLRANVQELCSLVRPRDVVLLHDPQTAGMAPALVEAGALVIWRCHIGHDRPNPHVDAGWEFLRGYLEQVPAFVFSRRAYVPEPWASDRAHVIQPSIDAFSPKNQELDPEHVRSILVHAGLVAGEAGEAVDHVFRRADGTPARVERCAEIVRYGMAPGADTPLVVQVSRWDPLKDMVGVMHGFARLVDGAAPRGAELVLAGPNVNAVADDPEGARVFEDAVEAWRELPELVRDRVHLAALPTEDLDENAAIVNALQRHAAIVVQKSLFEGFGLTVTEAMWKARPVVASAVGGIRDQIEDGVNGVLLGDPRDLDAFATALRGLLEEPPRARKLGEAARERVRDHFLGIRHLLEYAALIAALDGAS